MKAYRTYTQNGTVEFTDLQRALAYNAEFGVGDLEEFDIQIIFDKNAYEKELNIAYDAWFNSIIAPLEYRSPEEISLWISDEDFHQEAVALNNLYVQSWKMLKQHLEEVTQETADVEAFINTLPTFTL